MSILLDKINSPDDLKGLSVGELTQLAEEMREFITHSVSQTGGHLSSNLGVIELTIAMHRAFDFTTDRLLWDVGHQCYAHKILTGRRNQLQRANTISLASVMQEHQSQRPWEWPLVQHTTKPTKKSSHWLEMQAWLTVRHLRP
jgi:deoxyxylulose-5-phosphate synthase